MFYIVILIYNIQYIIIIIVCNIYNYNDIICFYNFYGIMFII